MSDEKLDLNLILSLANPHLKGATRDRPYSRYKYLCPNQEVLTPTLRSRPAAHEFLFVSFPFNFFVIYLQIVRHPFLFSTTGPASTMHAASSTRAAPNPSRDSLNRTTVSRKTRTISRKLRRWRRNIFATRRSCA